MATDTDKMRVIAQRAYDHVANDNDVERCLRKAADTIDALRSECVRLLGIVRLAESIEEVSYVNFEFTKRLGELGVIGGEDD